MSHQTKHLYQFGPFRLDIGERLLLRDSDSVPLTPKAFDLLHALVKHHGRLLEKDDLLKRVWPDTFVEEANLSYNISLIRKALGDGENGHKFIETVPKRGYRFVAGVQELSAEQAERTEAAVHKTEEEKRKESLTSQVKRHKKGALLALAVSVIAFGGLTFGLYKFSTRSESKSSGIEPKIVPVTSFPGSETQPAFSPDGNQVAFVWDAEQDDNLDIYVKLIDAGTPLRLTTNPAREWNPAWSPDSRYLAFIRESQRSERNGVYLIPALSGPERKLAEVARFESHLLIYGCGLSWSPDGKSLAVADRSSEAEPFGLFLLSVETGDKQRLTSPPAGYSGDYGPAFSRDGKRLAFARNAGGSSDLYVMSLSGGEPQRLTFSSSYIFGLTWTADGSEIVFSTMGQSLDSANLWRIPAAGGTPERMEAVGQRAINPVASRQGNRLAFVQVLSDLNIWRRRIPEATTGKAAPARLISSTYSDGSPQYSPDGKRIVFYSGRSGAPQIWVCEADGASPRQLTDLDHHHSDTGTPRWSPDGREIAFDSVEGGNRDIYVISAEGSRPRRLTTEVAEDMNPSWSHDGRWIYFGSNRNGSLQIWKLPVAGGQAVQVTKQGGFEGFESPDAKFFYYAKGRGIPGLWRLPVEGGAETFVLDHHQAGLWRSWAVVEQGIYFATAETGTRSLLEFFSFATSQITQIATLDKPIMKQSWGLCISPDGQWLLHTQFDQSGSDIMLMENFR